MRGSVRESCMYVTPMRLDLLLDTIQISCCKSKWYLRRFDPNLAPRVFVPLDQWNKDSGNEIDLIPIQLRTAIFILL